MRSVTLFRSLTALAVSGFSFLFTSGCAVVKRAGMTVLYEKAPLPAAQVETDISYGPHVRQKLDLFMPAGPKDWLVAVFVHGGSWTGGDKALKVGGQDVYGNIGRYLAGQGIGVAVINYRLQPQVRWEDQVADVGRAVGWVHQNMAARGGRPDQLFLFGHSAGAQLAAYAALDRRVLAAAGVPAQALRGVIPVSGAGHDLTDAGTYALGHSPNYYRSVFDPDNTNPAWQKNASAVTYIRKDAPPFLVMAGGSEEKAMIRQSVRLHEALQAEGVPVKFLLVPRQSHGRIVLALSRPDKTAGPEVISFIRQHTGKK